jgi:hypothetical protein
VAVIGVGGVGLHALQRPGSAAAGSSRATSANADAVVEARSGPFHEPARKLTAGVLRPQPLFSPTHFHEDPELPTLLRVLALHHSLHHFPRPLFVPKPDTYVDHTPTCHKDEKKD